MQSGKQHESVIIFGFVVSELVLEYNEQDILFKYSVRNISTLWFQLWQKEYYVIVCERSHEYENDR